MDKKKATLTLTEKLKELGYISLVTDPAVKSYLLNNAKSVILDLKKAGRVITHCVDSYYFSLSNFESETINRSMLPIGLSGYTAANYFFTEKNYDSSGSRFFVTPAAIIGEVEEQVLREKLYKNVPEEVVKAFEVLNIQNFIDDYSVYSSLKIEGVLPSSFGIYRPFKKEDKVELGDIIQGATSKRYYLVDKIKNDGSIEGYRFQDEALKIPVEGKKDGQKHSDCNKDFIIPIKKRLSDIGFFDFVFSLPYGEQNIEANKAILKNLSDTASCKILQKEYSEGKYFKDYFSLLSEGCQKKVVDSIKSSPKQDVSLNSWLFSQGFDVKMSHLELYKNDTEAFITYFKRSEKYVKELIVSDLFNCDYINKGVIEFLEKEYSQLLRDVSFKNEISTNKDKEDKSSDNKLKLTSRGGGGGGGFDG